MQKAIALAREAGKEGEVPVGALLISADGQILGQGGNQVEKLCDPTAHAEILAIRQASCNSRNYRLEGSILVSTLEPCPMCAGAIMHSRLAGVVFGASDPEQGAIVSCAEYLSCAATRDRIWHMGGICARECADLLKFFFQVRR